MANPLSRGKRLRGTLEKSLRAFCQGSAGEPSRPIIWGVTPQGTCVGGMTIDGFCEQATRILLGSGRLYRWGEDIVYEHPGPDDQRLQLLAVQGTPEASATHLLGNLFGVGVKQKTGDAQSLPPARLMNALLAGDYLRQHLPVIRHYTRRPIFDEDFRLLCPGWHAEQGVLVHGPDIIPRLTEPSHSPEAPACDRLPPLLRRLLAGFCWSGDADLTNAVGLLLTGFLANHFVDNAKPVGIIDGNQRGLGKTLLCQVIGRVLDDAVPAPLPLARDEELEKKLGAQLRASRSSIIFLDNVRERIESALLEQKILSPVLSYRILGQSSNIERPNTYLWLITSNMTSGTEDLINRGVCVQLHHEGNPRERAFAENLLEFAGKHRLAILGELAGMVQRWIDAGKPPGRQKHRCTRWAQVIGGILTHAGLDRFLTNVEKTEAEMDEELQALASMAEHVVTKSMNDYFHAASTAAKHGGQVPKDWVTVFRQTEVYQDKLAGKNQHGQVTAVGKVLAGKVNRSVRIHTPLGPATAVLCKTDGRSGQTRYHFEVTYEGKPDAVPEPGGDARQSHGSARRKDLMPGNTVHATMRATINRVGETTAGTPTAGSGEGNDLRWT
jgi:hypothetical protein